MKLIGNVHLVQGDASVLPTVLDALEAAGISTRANADLDVRTYAQFLVDDARSLVERALTKSVGGGQRVFIVMTPHLTYEAQNTMLKTLEEPASNALFFFIVPAPESLLGTIRSRAQIHVLGQSAADVIDPHAFLAATPQKRLDMLKEVLAKDETEARDISGALTLLSSLERILATSAAEYRAGIDAVYRARQYLGDKGSLLKTLLEQVALLTPIMKK